MCRYLYSNKLTGRVPSSLSALTELAFLCVPTLEPTAFARAAEQGRMGRLCSERAACRGMHVLGVEGGGAALGLLRRSQRGPRARDVTKEYSRGIPSYGYGARVPLGPMVALGVT